MPIDLDVAEHGPADAPALVLLHGFPLDRQMWRAQVDPLVRAGYRVLLPDLRGHGASARGDGAATMEAMARDVLAALDARGFVLVGLSMGGYVALEMVRQAPERVQALVLADTRAEADSPEAAQNRRETAAKLRTEGPGLLARTMLPKMLSPTTVAENPQLVAEVRGIVERQDAEGLAQALEGMAQRRDLRALLPEVRAPALVLVGALDAITPPAAARAMAEALPDARLAIVPQAGHLAPLENPGATNEALLGWLAER